jgi:hypothetical protein
VIIGVIVFLLLFIALLPLVLGSGKKKAKKPKRGVGKSQLCLQPGCLRCAFSTDPSSLHAFRRYLWQSVLDIVKDIEDETEMQLIKSRIGSAVKSLVTSPVPPAQMPSLLSLDGLSSSFASVMKRTHSETDTHPALSWIDTVLDALPRLAEEARQLWSERSLAQSEGAGGAKGRWRKQRRGEHTEWKWDLWNQGSLIEAHAQRAPETVRVLQQNVGNDLMVHSSSLLYAIVCADCPFAGTTGWLCLWLCLLPCDRADRRHGRRDRGRRPATAQRKERRKERNAK